MRTTTYTKRLGHDRYEISGFLADLRNDAAWRREVVHAEVVAGEPGQAGAEYLETVSTQGVQTQVRLAVTDFVAGSRLVIESREPSATSRYDYQFLPVEGGTEVTIFMTIETAGPLRLVEPLLWGQITRWVERDLARLDRALGDEEQPPKRAAAQVGPDIDIYDAHGETSRAFLGDVVDSLSEGVLLSSTEGRAFYANRAAERTLGIPRDAILGRFIDDPAFEFTTLEGEPIPGDQIPLVRVLKTGEAVLGSEYRVALGDSQITISENVVPLRLDGRTVGAAITFSDITERVETEARLKESEERFRAMLDQDTYGITIAAADGAILVYNGAMERITGIPVDEVMDKGWLVAAFPDEAERAQVTQVMEMSQRGEITYAEAPFVRRDGRPIWISYSSSPIRIHGKPYVFTIASDITQRAEAQTKVRFQAHLLEEVRNAVVATDMKGRITYANQEALRLYGRELDELQGADVMQLLRPRATDPSVPPPMSAMAHAQWEGEAEFLRPDGTEVPILLSLALLKNEQDEPEGLVSVAVDISDIKAAERALEEKDRAIRQAYVDVVGAVTGGKLVLMTLDELATVLGQPITDTQVLLPSTLADSRHSVMTMMVEHGIRTDPSTAVVAMGEAAANALKHAGRGEYQLFSGDGMLQVRVRDEGPGIDFRHLPKATLLPGYSSTQTLGMGFTIMLDLADRVLLATEPGHTQVVLEFARA